MEAQDDGTYKWNQNSGLSDNTNIVNRISPTLELKVVEDAVSDTILDIVWNKYFYYYTFFESLDGFSTTGTVTIGSAGVQLVTGGSAGDKAAFKKVPLNQNILDFNKEQRFRCNFETTSVTAVRSFAVVGNRFSANQSYYGIGIFDGVVSGMVSDGTTLGFANLNLTVAANENHDYEARLYPGSRVDFYVDGVVRGSIAYTSILPQNTNTTYNTNFYEIGLETTEAVAKTMHVSEFEYIQQRSKV